MTKHQTTEETQKNILRVAEALFMEFGYQAVSTRQVAKQCAISQPTLYYHFADKQELYVAVLLEALARMSREFEAIAGETGRSVEDRLSRIASYGMRQTHHDINLRNMLHDIESQLDQAARLKVSKAFFKSMIMPIVKVLQEVPRPEKGLSNVKLAFVFLNIISSGGDRDFQQIAGKNVSYDALDQEARLLTHFFLHGFLQS